MNPIRKIGRNLIARLVWRVNSRVDQHEVLIRALADANFRTRAMAKRAGNQPIRVLFICHEPAMWGMFESIYEAMAGDQEFAPLVVALPYAHGTLPEGEYPEGQYKDAGMMEFCAKRNIHAIWGFDKDKNEWLKPVSLMPDYVFFQQPYDLYAPPWSVGRVALHARVCYLPYATLCENEYFASVTHPEAFFRHVNLYFTECPAQRELLAKEFEGKTWYQKANIVLSGHPKLDYLTKRSARPHIVWKRGIQNDITRMLWTPRYRTLEETCHFFDYKDYFAGFCKDHPEVDFVFRPHPYCFQNFARTGELSREEQARMQSDYKKSLNMVIDTSGGYEDTFRTSDILVSDVSSMMIEFFATGKPIIYTHRKDVFNEYGRRMSQGLYWVRNVEELNRTLLMLLSGRDPLREKRQELMRDLFFIPEGGAGQAIKNRLQEDYATFGQPTLR